MSGMGYVLEMDAVKRRGATPHTVEENSVWSYSIDSSTWHCAYKTGAHIGRKEEGGEPRPRFAHQLAYDSARQLHYLFGGNPNPIRREPAAKDERLADFWVLRRQRPSATQIVQSCTYALRRQRFLELCHSDRAAALRYLQGPLREVVDHGDAGRAAEFQQLSGSLFAPEGAAADAAHGARSQLFQSIIAHFPDELVEPRGGLMDMVDPLKGVLRQ